MENKFKSYEQLMEEARCVSTTISNNDPGRLPDANWKCNNCYIEEGSAERIKTKMLCAKHY